MKFYEENGVIVIKIEEPFGSEELKKIHRKIAANAMGVQIYDKSRRIIAMFEIPQTGNVS